MVSCAAAVAAWVLSDANTVRKERLAWGAALQHVQKRVEVLEVAQPQYRMEMARLADESEAHLDEARTIRRRQAGAAGGAAKAAAREAREEENGPPPAPGTPGYDAAVEAMRDRYRGR